MLISVWVTKWMRNIKKWCYSWYVTNQSEFESCMSLKIHFLIAS